VAHHFSSGKSASHRSRICVESYSMFDVSSLSPRDQFEAAVVVSGVCLAAAVLLREWFADREIRIMARILGAAGWAVVVTFAWRMTETNETLATQIMVQKGVKDATSIADPVRVVAAQKEYVATDSTGLTVSVTRFDDGRTGPLSVTRGRNCINDDPDSATRGQWSFAGESTGGSDRRAGELQAGRTGRRF
jgi:hypothetical protein